MPGPHVSRRVDEYRSAGGSRKRADPPGILTPIPQSCPHHDSLLHREVDRMAGQRETDALEPIDEALGRRVRESPGRNGSERRGSPEIEEPRRPSGWELREGSRDRRTLVGAAGPLRRGGSGGTVTRTRRATGEALLAPPRNRRDRIRPITSAPGKWAEGERVAEGSAVAVKRGNARGAKGPCCSAIPPTTRKAGAT